MKLKHTQAKKANRLNLRYPNKTSDPVWLRRLRGTYGADHRTFDAKYPRIEPMVEGLRKRIEQQGRA